MPDDNLTPKQQAMVEIWEAHMAAEFKQKDIDATMATMSSNLFVNHVPVMTGDVGFSAVRRFYTTYFIPHHPSDTAFVHVARTVGEDRIVDELIHKFGNYHIAPIQQFSDKFLNIVPGQKIPLQRNSSQ